MPDRRPMHFSRQFGAGILGLLLVLLSGCGGGGSSAPATFTVGGTVSGLTGVLVLQNNGGDDLAISANGRYTFSGELLSGSNYSVRVATFPRSQDCSIANATGTLQANVANVDVLCRDLEPIRLASLSSLDVQGDLISELPAISADGRVVAFESAAATLVPVDTNLVRDIFVRDRGSLQSTTTRVSISSAGVQAEGGDSFSPALSGDGRYVAFVSAATNLVANDTNLVDDVFVHDRLQAITERVSVSSLASGTLQADNASAQPALSADGRHVAFASLAANLVAGDTNNFADIFVRELESGIIERVSVSSLASGTLQADNASAQPALSGDGRFVVFESDATNLVDGDTNSFPDIFVRDRELQTTTRVSLSSLGDQADRGSRAAAITPDGRYVVFASDATSLVPEDSDTITDIYRHDRQTGQTILVSVSSAGIKGNGASDFPAISADGRFVAFESAANNLVSDDSNSAIDIFVRDLVGGTTVRRNLAAGGAQAALGDSFNPALSADGNYLAFDAAATNLVSVDLNNARDVFVAPAK